MKKRITAIFMISILLCVIIPFSSCKKEEVSIQKAISDAIEKNKALDSFEAQITIVSENKLGETFITYPSNTNLKVENANSDKPLIFLSSVSTVLDLKSDIYADSEWVYFDSSSFQYKTTIEESAYVRDYISIAKGILKPISDELIENSASVEDNYGIRSVTVDIPAKEFFESYGELMDIAYFLQGIERDIENKISGARVSITLSGGYVSSYSISYETHEKSTADSIVNIGVIFKNPGDKVTVVPMAGYESFKEVDDYFADFGKAD